MPRDRQPAQAPNAQAYGLRGDQIAAQQAIPLPQAPNQMPDPAQPGPPDDALMSAATQFDPGITPLTAASERPGEPVTAGLSRGPGPGPEIFTQPARARRAAEVLTMIGHSSGNDRLLQLADRIRQTGGFL